MIEAAVRGGAIALLLMFAVAGWQCKRHLTAERYGVLLALCGVAYLVEAAPGIVNQCPPWIIPLRLLSLSAPAVFYLWSAAHFDDEFSPSWQRWLPWLGMIALGGWAIASGQQVAWRSVQIAGLVLVGLGAWHALVGREGDLVETRRRFRLILAIGAGVFIAGLNLLAFVLHGNVNLSVGIAGPAALAVLAFAACLLRFIASDQNQGVSPAPTGAVGRENALPRPPALPAAEEALLLDRLEHLMERDKAYREDGFGIAALASRLGIPEYRLRRLINRRLGHRNFAAFVNGYRLAEAAAALADPGQARVPVLTIALDTGFQSIGPFNRAFKVQFGLTPSEFRRDRLTTSAVRAAE